MTIQQHSIQHSTQQAKQTIWAVFSKPWPLHSAEDLAKLVTGMGFSGVELPVRANTAVTPENAVAELPNYVASLKEHGVETISVAADLREEIFAACQSSGVPLIRIMVKVSDNDFVASLRLARRQLAEAASWAQKYGVRVGIQPHRGQYITSCLGAMNLLDGLRSEYFSIIWDAAHDSLSGEDPVTSLKLVAQHLSIANFKNVTYRKQKTGESHSTVWEPWYVPGPDGLADWDRALGQLHKQHYAGPFCLTAQYSDVGQDLETQLRNDLSYAQRLWRQHINPISKGQ